MHFNIGSAFLQVAAKVPDRVAINDPEQVLTFQQLANAVTIFALHFQANSVKRGSLVAVRSKDPLVILASSLATSLLGCGWIYSSPKLVGDSAPRPDYVFSSEITETDIAAGHLPIDKSWGMPPPGFEALKSPVFLGPVSPEDTCIVFSSSGTTGVPKFMELSHRMINLRMQSNAVEFKDKTGACLFLFPQHSPPSLMRSICTLLCGWSLVFSDSPEFWKEAGVTHIFASPLQIREIIKTIEFPHKFHKALIGGDNMPDVLAKSLLENFETVVNTFGSTETNIILENRKHLDSDGKIATKTRWFDSQLEIVDDQDVVCQAGKSGAVRIKNDFSVDGYFGQAQANPATFRDGWFYTGDIGILTESKNFFITGRSTDIFNIGGTKVSAMLIDSVLQSIKGVEDAICFIIPDDNGEKELIAFVKSDGTLTQTFLNSEARVQIALNIGLEAIPNKILMSDVIPRNELGKPDRNGCVQLAKTARAGDVN